MSYVVVKRVDDAVALLSERAFASRQEALLELAHVLGDPRLLEEGADYVVLDLDASSPVLLLPVEPEMAHDEVAAESLDMEAALADVPQADATPAESTAIQTLIVEEAVLEEATVDDSIPAEVVIETVGTDEGIPDVALAAAFSEEPEPA